MAFNNIKNSIEIVSAPTETSLFSLKETFYGAFLRIIYHSAGFFFKTIFYLCTYFSQTLACNLTLRKVRNRAIKMFYLLLTYNQNMKRS